MFKSLRSLFISFTIVTFILFSTVGTTTAYADDDDGTGTDTTETETTGGSEEEQPSEPIAEETPPPTEEESSSDVVVDVTPAPTEEGQPEEETDLSSEETIVEDESLGTIMEQVPDNTTLTVLNSEGEALPLASQESADAIQSAYDPIWCPAGQVPTPGANGCTQSFDSFDELLTFLQANEVDVAYQQAGTIYIQQGAYLGGETSIDFNNYNFNQINNHNLTLQGGWDTTYDPNVNGDPTYTTTTFDVPIIIGSDTNPWAGSLTINNISINGVSNQSGLMLHSDSDINLDNVAVTNSQSGAELNAGGNVKVNNSKFNNNGSGNIEDPVGKGLDIVSGGNVSLASVEGNNNQLFGTNIQTVGAVVVLNSFFNGNKSYTFSSSTGTTTYFGYGIQVFTNSEVSFVEVEATENYLYGAYIDGKDVAVDTANFSNNGSGSGTDLTGSGLQVVSDFEVALAGVTADNNQLFGADITAGDLVAIERSSFNGHLAYIDGSTITYILGYSTEEAVDRTGGYGLRVVTLGNIAVEDVTANNNYLYGAYLEGDDTAVEGNVTGSSFVGNGSGIISVPTGNDYGYGLKIVSTGSVSLYNINDANSAGNQLFGADISAVQDVTIVNSFFSGNQSVAITPEMDMTFYGYGLTVVTPGDITLNYVVANHNNLWGGSLTGNNVEIGNSQFNNNISDSNVFIDDTGLLVNAQGNVDIFNSEANENRLIGADIKAEVMSSSNKVISTSIAVTPAKMNIP